MTEKEVIEQIESLIDDRNSFIDSTDKSEDNIFRKDKEALQTVLQLLEQKDNKINKVIDKLKEELNYCNTLKNQYDKCALQCKFYEKLLKILEE